MKKGIILINLMLCAVLADAIAKKPEYPVENISPLVAPELIAEAGWAQNWQISLPVKEGEKLEKIAVFGPHLYVMTDSNVMFCINRQSGKLRFTEQLSVRRLPIQKPMHYDGKFWFVVGNELLVFDPEIGDFVTKETFKQVGSGIGSGLARNEKFIYISGSDKRLHAMNVDGYWQQFTATADNDSPIVSIIATDDIVVFATLAGNVVGMKPDKAEKIWQFDATGDIRGQLVMDGEDVYVGSYDSKLYKLGILSGLMKWKTPFHSGAPIRDSFSVGRNVIYVYNALNGLYGVNKQTGQAVWQVPSGEGMVCETDQKGYIYASPGILKVMDNSKGKELYSVNIADVEFYAHNTVDAVMYLTESKGRVASISVE